ncbi:MAG: DUF1858 domain-containing protein [Anaerolineae bacterium]
MDQADSLARMTIENLLDAHPQVSAIFIRRRMACIGCALSSYCTLAYAAHVYDISLPSLIAECQAAINRSSGNVAGSVHPQEKTNGYRNSKEK